MTRRVVTGLDDTGRSCVVIDGQARRFTQGGGAYVWRTDAVPADNLTGGDAAPPAFSFDMFHDGGTNFFVIEMAPGTRSSTHATDTIDYIVAMAGTVVLELEAGEVSLHAGDTLVDRGVVHAWRNEGPDPVRYAVVTIPALPVGDGRTV